MSTHTPPSGSATRSHENTRVNDLCALTHTAVCAAEQPAATKCTTVKHFHAVDLQAHTLSRPCGSAQQQQGCIQGVRNTGQLLAAHEWHPSQVFSKALRILHSMYTHTPCPSVMQNLSPNTLPQSTAHAPQTTQLMQSPHRTIPDTHTPPPCSSHHTWLRSACNSLGAQVLGFSPQTISPKP